MQIKKLTARHYILMSMAMNKSQSGKIIVNVEDNVTFTIIENFKGESSTEGRVALRTLIDTGLNSKVRLIQVYMQPESIDVLSCTGCRLSDNATFENLAFRYS